MSLQMTFPNKPWLFDPGVPIGEDSTIIADRIKVMEPLRYRQDWFDNNARRQSPPQPLKERLFDARAVCKIEASSVAMYFSNEWRSRFFAQLDNLMDEENWEEEDIPITKESFSTLLRMLLLIKPTRRPGLGATSDGHIIAAWTRDKDRLTVECLPKDTVRWALSRYWVQERESSAGQNQLTRLAAVLAPYDPERWFSDGD